MYAQEKKYVPQTLVDTVHIEKNTVVIGKDSVFFAKKDTVIYVQDTINSKIGSLLLQEEEEKAFYDSLTNNDSSKLKKKIVDLILDDVSEEKDTTAVEEAPQLSIDVEGKVVGNITITGLEVFGPNVNDTTSDKTNTLSKFANKVHMYTRERVIRKRLLIKKGDQLTSAKLLDNERLIRSLPYIRDARFVVQAASGDTVNLLLITQDLIAYTARVDPNGLDGGNFGINNINILGYGHQLYNTVKIDTDRQRKLGYVGEYRIPNINSSQLEGVAAYENTIYQNRYSLRVERDFLTPGIKVAGGAFIEYRKESAYAPWIDSYEILENFEHEEDIPRQTFKRFTQDYWLGRSFTPEFITTIDPRARLVTAIRYQHKKYYDRPEVTYSEYRAYHDRHLLLMSVGLSRNNFTTERLVYGYGRTEDIPIGSMSELIFGPEKGEFYNRFFTGMRIVRASYLAPLGYISGGFRVGGYWRNQNFEDGLFQAGVRTFSFPIQWRRTTYRLFINADYSLGIQQINPEDFRQNMISLNDRNGIRGLKSHEMYGHKRLALSLETVAYLPFDFYSFRLATFFFADAGLVAQKTERLINSPLYQGYGLGFRIRNDRLAYKTFQLRLACYPNAPSGESFFKITLAGIPVPDLMNFSINKPEAFEFE
ncbi:hypothetical protein PZB74_02325 [Porifericola rhodea]|uniref:hypothetical protein n=1 Tax=Porifericola rhodea TaxID=930972 RepID=UPI002665BD00|nr:hypothetical protein [Porifericola rhodea]WKN32190.1 hypothetical protein PZB74_02325 [Porifericola rhodea]